MNLMPLYDFRASHCPLKIPLILAQWGDECEGGVGFLPMPRVGWLRAEISAVFLWGRDTGKLYRLERPVWRLNFSVPALVRFDNRKYYVSLLLWFHQYGNDLLIYTITGYKLSSGQLFYINGKCWHVALYLVSMNIWFLGWTSQRIPMKLMLNKEWWNNSSLPTCSSDPFWFCVFLMSTKLSTGSHA